VCEGTVRYHLKRQAGGAQDGGARQPFKAAAHHEAIAGWLAERGAMNLAQLHAWLVEERGYEGTCFRPGTSSR